ncbi:hypothetical protein GCK32_021817 [Trichostrongylus colubriformis]|uniref:Uncharacterized protein n=1 Tax=Trichostrongylus colubriformis TaxID=6319 RepID=A0AAN8G818_TRICO
MGHFDLPVLALQAAFGTVKTKLDILRYVSDSALSDGTPRTAVDMPTILKGQVDKYGHLLDEELTEMCRTYKHGRQLLETYLFEPE